MEQTMLSKGSAGRRFIAVALVCALAAGGVTFGTLVQNAEQSGITSQAALAGSVHPFTSSIGVGEAPNAEAYDSGKGEIFVANSATNNVSVINDTTDTVVTNILVGYAPIAAAYDSGKGEIYVVNWGSANVSVINDTTNTVVKTIAIGTGPFGVAYDRAKGELFVANKNSGNLSVINDTTLTVTSSIALPIGPTMTADSPLGVAYDPTKGEVFVVASEALSTLPYYELALVYSDTNDSLAANVNIGNYTTGELAAVYDSARGEVFITIPFSGIPNSYTGTTIVVSDTTNTVVASAGEDLNDPDALAYDPSLGEVFVGNYGDVHVQSNVSVVDDATNDVTATIPVGLQPDAAVYDSGNGDVYVANYGGNNVTVISAGTAVPKYAVTFTESGLLPGTSWSLTLNGTEGSSTTNSIQFEESNGAYSFTIGSVSGYNPNPPAGHLNVNGSAVALSITFATSVPGAYLLSFTETGLPGGTNWSVEVGSSTHFSTGSLVEFEEMNGTYDYRVGGIGGYTDSPPSGEVNISGKAANLDVAFTLKLGGAPPAPTAASGLPPVDYAVIGILAAIVVIILVILLTRRRRKDTVPPTPSQGPGFGNPPPPQ
jgi:YVTN family beta-propeller protein